MRLRRQTRYLHNVIARIWNVFIPELSLQHHNSFTTQMGILFRGKIITEVTPSQLKEKFQAEHLRSVYVEACASYEGQKLAIDDGNEGKQLPSEDLAFNEVTADNDTNNNDSTELQNNIMQPTEETASGASILDNAKAESESNDLWSDTKDQYKTPKSKYSLRGLLYKAKVSLKISWLYVPHTNRLHFIF